MSWLGFIDESEWQGGSIDFADEYSRYDGIILRAGHGMRVDKYFLRNLPLARAVVDDYASRGVAKYLGFYWYEEYGPDPTHQGDTFVSETPCRPQAGIRPPEFRCWDHEDPGQPAGMSRTAYAVAAISEVRKTGCCFGYSFASYDPNMAWVDASSGAWVAAYQSHIPTFGRPVVIWQDTDSAYAGRSVSGNPDGDLIVDLARFHAAIGYSPAASAPPALIVDQGDDMTPQVTERPGGFEGHDCYDVLVDGVGDDVGTTADGRHVRVVRSDVVVRRRDANQEEFQVFAAESGNPPALVGGRPETGSRISCPKAGLVSIVDDQDTHMLLVEYDRVIA